MENVETHVSVLIVPRLTHLNTVLPADSSYHILDVMTLMWHRFYGEGNSHDDSGKLGKYF